MGPRFTSFGGSQSCGPAECLALLLMKAGDVGTNPGPTTRHKQVWFCVICHKHTHGRKRISIRCNRTEHKVHIRCAAIRQAQYTDTWTCNLQKNPDSHPSRPWSKPTTHFPPQPKHRHTSNTPPVPTGLVNPFATDFFGGLTEFKYVILNYVLVILLSFSYYFTQNCPSYIK